LLTPVVVAAALARSRGRGGPESETEPYPDASRQTSRSNGDGTMQNAGKHATQSGRSGAASGSQKGSPPPGRDAESPTQVPAAGWKEILKRTKQQVNEDNISLLAAGVAFYIFIALFPALIAAVTIYGLVSDPAEVEQQVAEFAGALPADTAQLIEDQLKSIAQNSGTSLGIGLLASLAGALFAASGGMQNLIKAINIAYDETETRNFIKLRLVALAMTLALIAFLVIAVGLVAILPVILDRLAPGPIATVGVQVARWLGLFAFVAVCLAILYRYAPDRDQPKFKWVGLGSVVATVLWVVGSAGFSFYVSRFGSYDKTYGALAGVIVLLLWLFLTSFIILLGAEINSESEQQTAKDTTKGPEKPMGERDAVKADSLPG
jgi:membrane protein